MAWKWTSDSKLCFVTMGATAPFNDLIESVLSPSCLDTLLESGFTHLLVQYGSARDVYEQFSALARAYMQETKAKRDLIIDGIGFNPDGLQAQFQLVQRSKGLVISHAGTDDCATLILIN
jgi:beta-1,4-N-acetylglucosaminyltransferase